MKPIKARDSVVGPQTRFSGDHVGNAGCRFWALKTTTGKGKDQVTFWPNFVSESVIAIAWSRIGVDPSKVSEPQLLSAIRNAFPDESEKLVANKIKKFVELQEGDLVLVCHGYSSSPQANLVRIYGFARVSGPFRDERTEKSGWSWTFKHKADIQIVNRQLPRDVIARALGKESLMQTIHELDRSGIERLIEKLGVRLEV